VTLRSKKLGLFPEGSDQLRPVDFAADALERLGGKVAELPDVLRAEVGQLVPFPVGPEIFDGIKLRGIGRQIGHRDTLAMGFHIATHAQTAVDLSPVPDDEDLAGKEAPELAEEGDDLGGPDGSPVQAEAKGATGYAGNGRQLLPVEAELEDGRLACRRPGAHTMGAARRGRSRR
jgi:hypothetical protein